MAEELNDVINKEIDPDWFKRVIHMQGSSIRKLGADKGISKTERTIRRAVKSRSISYELLDEIAKKLNVHPDYLAGKYVWTLTCTKYMDMDGVRDYWIDNFLNPSRFPYQLVERERIGLYKHLLDTLLLHGITEADYKKLNWEQRRELKHTLDQSSTLILSHWFPNLAEPIYYIEHSYVMEWEDKNDVIDAMEEYLVARGFLKLYDVSPDGLLIPVQILS